MANEQAAYAVPDFKVARVGKERKKKGMGFSFFKSPGKPGAWVGVKGGASAVGTVGGNALGLTLAKTMMIVAFASALGASTLGLIRGNGDAEAVLAKPDIFAKTDPVKFEGDTSNLPSTPNSMPNSLGYVSGSADGLTSEERARLAAEAEAKKLAEEEAARKAEEETAAQNQTAQNPMDPAAMMAAAQEGGDKKGSPFGKKFGALSSSFGGGQSSLSGGAGLSAGVARNFNSGGPGGPRGKGGQLGNMGGVGSRVKMAGASRARVSPSNVKGFARRQLANANALSRRGMAASRGETASYDASSAFDNNDGAGNVITGAGIGTGGGAGEGRPETPNTVNNGGPTGGGSGGEDCGSNAYFDANSGTCVPLAAPNKQSKSQMADMLAQIAQGLLITISVLAIAMVALTDAVLTAGLGAVISGVILALSTIIAMLGLALIASGDYYGGSVYTVVGAFIAVFSTPVTGYMLTYAGAIVFSAAGALLGQAAKMLAPQKD